MSLKNTHETWGSVHKALHWTIALAVIALATVGWLMEDMPNSPTKIKVYALHKSVGLTVLALVAVRLAWRWSQPRPELPPTMLPWERRLAHLVHFGLYGTLVAMPLSGWLFNSWSNFPLKWFGLFRVPALAGPDRDLAHLAADAHLLLAWTLAGLFTLHVAGALKHHFIDRDDVLRRMLPSGRRVERDDVVPGDAPMKNVHRLALALLVFASSVEARPYVVLPGRSTVTFTGTYEGEPFDGRFAKFAATVSVDPADPAKTAIAAEIDVASVDTQNAERDETLATPDFFDASRFPKAMFATTACRGKAPAFTCDASLTIRDRTQPIVFPFKWTQRADGRATLVARVVLKRLAFDVGRGDWADSALIADDVTVRISLALTPKK